MALTYRSLGMAASLLVLALAPARAERAMSCQDFRLALWRAIDDDGNKVARPQLNKAVGGFGPTISYEMKEIVGLEGHLICWKDQIFNFSATARLSSDPTETSLRILRFKNLAAAAICALGSPQPTLQECASLAETIARGAMDEYAKARAGEVHGAEVGARLKGESHIEMAADADSLAFFLYPF
jgi:hypothetical protein